jgi:two-component system, chemotaxis family, CheB/CheR fusion protein
MPQLIVEDRDDHPVDRDNSELLDISSDAIFVWELDGVIRYWNKGASMLYGFSSAEAIGHISHALLSTSHPLGIDNVVEALRCRGSWQGELTHRTKSGAVLTVWSSMQVVFRGSRALVMESNRDLTERKRMEDLLREADRRKDEFLAVLSHELRNPLAPIQNVAAILNSPSLGEEQLEWARRVLQRQVAHMTRLLDDLLDITRITRGQLVLRTRPVSLNEVVETAVEAVSSIIDKKAHRLTVDLPGVVPVLDGDPVRLAQVLSNLLTNSAKYTDRGGSIRLTARVKDSSLSLSVKDNGIGISSEQIPHLFTMFSRLGGAQDQSEGGLGIGLALAKAIVELHGGAIEVTSAGRGAGSEFQIRLPLLPPNLAPPTGVPEPSVRGAEAPSTRILIADDNLDGADSLALLLRLDHHEVRVARNGRSALSLADTFRPDIAFLDIGMPELDGYEVARALREKSWGADIYLIALTGRGYQQDERRAVEAGFDRHLRKPYEFTELQAMIASHRGHTKPEQPSYIAS